MAASDYRDVVITDLADERAAMEDQLVEALRSVDSYRLLAQLAIHENAKLTAANDNLRKRNAALVDQMREWMDVGDAMPGAAA